MGGIASDGKNPVVTTGNTFSPPNWEGGDAVIRFQPGPIFSGSPADYWAPEDWLTLNSLDFDLGSSGPLLVDVPGATPSHLVVALSKDLKMYLLNRDNLGGISAPIAESVVASGTIIQAAVTYRTLRANNDGNTVLSAWRITPTNPPAIASSWNVPRNNGGDQRLHGYDGDTGAVIYDGGGPNELMAGTHYYNTSGIVARGRIYVAGDNKVYAFGVASPSPTPRPAPTPRVRPTTPPRPLRPR